MDLKMQTIWRTAISNPTYGIAISFLMMHTSNIKYSQYRIESIRTNVYNNAPETSLTKLALRLLFKI